MRTLALAATAALLALAVPPRLAAPAFGETRRIGGEQTLNRRVAPGGTVRVFTYGRWDSACNPLPAPDVVMRTQPQHGTVVIQSGQTEVRMIREGAADRTGRVMPGTAVFYRAEPGYRGTVQFDYDVLNGGEARHDTAVIQIN